MILFFVINILCYLLLCCMVFFPFRDKWNMETLGGSEESVEEESDEEGVDKDEDGSSDGESNYGSDSGNDDGVTKEKVKVTCKVGSVSEDNSNIVRKCFELISAVDYFNLDNDCQTTVDSPVKLTDKKYSGSMFEELLKCLEGKSRSDFYTWDDVLSGSKDSVQILLKRGFSINGTDRDGNTLLHYTCRVGDKSTVKDLLNKGAVIMYNKKQESPLHIAVNNCDVEIAETLVDCGAQVNYSDSFGYSPLHLAAKSGDVNMVNLLLKCGANVSAGTDSDIRPVHFAIKNCQVLKLLIDEKVDLNCCSKDGSTPLHFAARGNCLESLDLLLKNRATINCRDVNGSTPLLVQCKNFSFYSEDNSRCYECVKFLLDRGACVNVTDYTGSSPLHFASENELVDIMELLLEFGADPNVVSEIGDSPLHIAVRNQSLEVVYTLLEWGADFNVAGALGETPLDIAAQSLLMFNVWNYSSEILVKHMAKLSSAGINMIFNDSSSILSKKMSSEFVRRCSEECSKLSSKTLVWPITYLDFLTIFEGNLTKYVRNECAEEVFKTGDYMIDFPLYSSYLTLRFRWGFERNYLLKKSFKFMRNVTPHLPTLPFDCFEKLCQYLKLSDLRNLAHAFQCDMAGSEVTDSCIICKGTVMLPKQKIAQPPGTKRFHLIKILNY